MGKHTPGPWRWDQYGWNLIAPGATVLLPRKDANGFAECGGSLADKALIAAAPDLLAACEAINDLSAPLSRLTGGSDEAWECAVRLVRDAIVRAKPAT